MRNFCLRSALLCLKKMCMDLFKMSNSEDSARLFNYENRILVTNYSDMFSHHALYPIQRRLLYISYRTIFLNLGQKYKDFSMCTTQVVVHITVLNLLTSLWIYREPFIKVWGCIWIVLICVVAHVLDMLWTYKSTLSSSFLSIFDFPVGKKT